MFIVTFLLLIFPPALTFSSGALLVCVSIYLYGLPKQDTSTLSKPSSANNASKEKLISV